MTQHVGRAAGLPWPDILDRLRGAGWTAAVVDATRLDDVTGRVAGVLASGDLPGPTVEHLAGETGFAWPANVTPARSVVVAATARPLTRATLTAGGRTHQIVVPPHYAGYRTVPDGLAAALREALAPHGYTAERFEPPLKTLAACAGLARYGRNNIAYVADLGSYLMLAACACDAPPPPGAPWGKPLQLDRCDRCSACLRACPSGAIRVDRFLLQTDRCLTCVNESEAPFPDWVDPAWHHAAVGCLRCQQSCPENAAVDLLVDEPVVFDDEESAAVLSGSGMVSPEVEVRLARCGLDYSPALIARNLGALLGD
jgi:epoxyqueuosine reductase